MSNEKSIFNLAVEILEEDGIIFENSPEIGYYISPHIGKTKLFQELEDHFKFLGYIFIARSFGNLKTKDYQYFLYVNDILERLYPQYTSSNDLLKHVISTHFGIPEQIITFDYI